MTQAGTFARIDRALGVLTARVFDVADIAEVADVHDVADAADVADDSDAGGGKVKRAMAVGCSGGLDSSVLLHAAQRHAARHHITLYAFHVHHGLADQADAWQAHVRAQAAQLGIPFDTCNIAVDPAGNGVEGAARSGRYAALGALCRQHGVPLLLTAHHQDDQAETVLLQLLRGSGVAGLSGMDSFNTAPSLLGDPTLLMARPMLDLSRASIEDAAREAGIAHVEDPSNADPRFARNALRHQVMPVLEAAFPGFAQRLARSAEHAQAAQSLLIALAQEDFNRCAEGDDLVIENIRLLDDARIDNLLRYWFGLRGKRMPSTAWLQQLRRQLFGAKHDAQILVSHPECEIHRHRGRIVMTARSNTNDLAQAPQVFRWDGSAAMRFPDFGGTLHFEPAEEGVDPDWLRAQGLLLQWRGAGFRLKPAANRATRSLKYHYQVADIPAWERSRLPLVTLRDASQAAPTDFDTAAFYLAHPEISPSQSLPPLLYAAGIGMECTHFSAGEGDRIALRWEGDPAQPR